MIYNSNTSKRILSVLLMLSLLLSGVSATAIANAASTIDLKLSLSANPKTNTAYKNTPGKFKVTFSGSWNNSTKYKDYIKKGWSFKYSLLDQNDNVLIEDFDIDGNPQFSIKNNNVKYILVATASKPGQSDIVIKSNVIPAFKFPAAPNKFTVSCKKDDNNVTIKWNKSNSAKGYYIYRGTNGKVNPTPYKKLAGNYSLTFHDNNLSGKKTYTYSVRAYFSGTNNGIKYHTSSKATAKQSITVKRFLTTKIRTIGWHVTTKQKATIYSKKKSGIKRGTINKGIRVIVDGKSTRVPYPWKKHPKRVHIVYKKNGKVIKKGWIGWAAVKHVSETVAYDKKTKEALDWTTAKKEAYVNNSGYRSSSKYLIWCNLYTQRVNIFKGSKGNWKLYKTYRCTSGNFEQNTTPGKNFRLYKHQMVRKRYRASMGHYYYTHLSYFSGDNSFHSVVYKAGTKKIINNVKKDLSTSTKGCVRMPASAAKWIYYNCPLGTRAVVY